MAHATDLLFGGVVRALVEAAVREQSIVQSDLTRSERACFVSIQTLRGGEVDGRWW